MPTASRSAALRTPTCAIAVCTIHLLACEAISQKARAAAGVASTCAVAILVGVSDIARSTATSAASAQVALARRRLAAVVVRVVVGVVVGIVICIVFGTLF